MRSEPIYFNKLEGENTLYINIPNDGFVVSTSYAYKGSTPVKNIPSLNISILNKEVNFIADGTFDNIRVSFARYDGGVINEEDIEESGVFTPFNPYFISIKEQLNLSVNFEYGGVDKNGALIDNNIRVRSLPIYVNNFKMIIPNGFSFVHAYAYSGNTPIKLINDITISSGNVTFAFDDSFDNIRISFRKGDDLEITQEELSQCKVSFSTKSQVFKNTDNIAKLKNNADSFPQKNSTNLISSGGVFDAVVVNNNIPFEYGGIDTSGTLVENKIRVRSLPIYFGNKSQFKFAKPNTLVFTAPTTLYAYKGSIPVKVIPNLVISNYTISFTPDDSFDNIRICFMKPDSSEISQEELDGCYIINEVLIKEELPKLKEKVTITTSTIFNYKGLKYCALGDSITYGFIPRNYTGYPGQLNSYAKLTAQKLDMTFVNYGINGSSLAHVDGRAPMSERYTNMADDADVITFMGGTNDVRNGVQLGTMSDRDNTTYYGALHVLMQGLYTKYIAGVDPSIGKQRKIVALTPIKLLNASKAYNENTIENNANALDDLTPWVNAVKEVAAFYSIPCLDFYNLSGINPHLNRTLKGNQDGYNGYYNPYITDGTHPTQEGAEIMSDILVGFLKTLK